MSPVIGRLHLPLLALLAMAFAGAGRAEPPHPPQDKPDAKPLWELGVGGGGAYVPDYPAASHGHFAGIAVPLVIYRGNFFRSDEDGVRTEVDLNPRLQLKLGGDAAFNAKSKDDPARRGMPNLPYLLELGPSLEYRAWESGPRSITAIGQVRAAFSANSHHFGYTGITVEPQLQYVDEDFLVPHLQLLASLAPKAAYDGVNQLYYTVKPEFATQDRPAYRGHDGYQQTALSTRLFFPVTPRLSVFAANQLFYDDGSANRNSPLYRKDFTYAFGAGLAWSLWVSDRKAQKPDDTP